VRVEITFDPFGGLGGLVGINDDRSLERGRHVKIIPGAKKELVHNEPEDEGRNEDQGNA